MFANQAMTLEGETSAWESLEELNRLSTEQREAHHAFDRVDHSCDEAVDRHDTVFGNEDAIPWHELIVCRRRRSARNRLPVDR